MPFCRSCGNPLEEGQRFCGKCGQPVAQSGAEPSEATRQAPPSETAYAPPPQPNAGYAPPPASGPSYGAGPAYPPPAPSYGQGQPYGQMAYAPPQRRRGKGLWIGLGAFLLAVVVACVLVFVVFHDNIFTDESTASNSPQNTTAGQTADLSNKSSPTAIMASSLLNIGSSESLKGTFDLKISFDTDGSLPSEQAQMFDKPWTLSGSLAYKSTDQAGDIELSLGLMGQTMEVAMKLLGDQAWIGLGDQWYEAPMDTEQQLADVGVSETLGTLQEMLSSLAVDPTSWLKDQSPVKEEKIDGVKVLHISGSNPDWAKMMSDLAQIMSSPEYASLMSSAGSTASELESQLPSPDELADMQSQLDSVLKNVTVDLWVETDTAVFRKAVLNCDISTAASGSEEDLVGGLGLDSMGITGASLAVTITVNPNESVKVEAPKSSKSFDELQTDLEADPSLLGPLGSMLMGMGGF